MTITIKDISTRELIPALRNFRFPGDWHTVKELPEGMEPQTVLVGTRIAQGGQVVSVHATREEILAELDTRPHIPGKKEAKVIRRLQAQTGHTEEYLRAHSKYGQEIVDAQFPNRRTITAAEAKKWSPLYGKWFGTAFKIVD